MENVSENEIDKIIDQFCKKCSSPIETSLPHPNGGSVDICTKNHAIYVNDSK
jgi:hypothetical protein